MAFSQALSLFNTILKYDKSVSLKFRNFKGIKASYRFSSMGIPHEGEIICFNMPGKLATVMMQEATEDKKYYKAGFDHIRKTFPAL